MPAASPTAPERWTAPPTSGLQILADVFPASVRLPLSADPRPSAQGDPITPARLVVTYTPAPEPELTLHVFSDSYVGPARIYTSALPLAPDPYPAPAAPAPAPIALSGAAPAANVMPAVSIPTPTATSGAIPTDDGTLFWTRETGCGCGSAMKTFRPFPGAPQLG